MFWKKKSPAPAAKTNSFDLLKTVPILMTWSERVVLYSLIYGLKPKRCLEIGTHKGGSSMIICAAMDDIGGAGKLVCVDPNPVVEPANWQTISHRATMLKGNSPEILSKAVAAAGGAFDFALIDGDHEAPGVVKDIEGTLPLLADHAYLLFHDVHYRGVKEGLRQALGRNAECLTDCGLVSVEATPDGNNPEVFWGGLQLWRFHKQAKQARVA